MTEVENTIVYHRMNSVWAKERDRTRSLFFHYPEEIWVATV